MTTKAAIDGFMSQPILAVAGVSRNPANFGNAAYRGFKSKGYQVLAVNPNLQQIEEDPCYPSLKALPEKVGGLLVFTKPTVSEQLVREAVELGIANIWLQPGSESPTVVQYCQDHGVNAVSGECIFMYQPNPAFIHKFHKIVKEAFGGKLE